MIKGTVKDHFSKSMDSLFTNIKREGLPIDHEDMKSLIFGDYMDPDAEGDDRLYKEISGQFSNCGLLDLQASEQLGKERNEILGDLRQKRGDGLNDA